LGEAELYFKAISGITMVEARHEALKTILGWEGDVEEILTRLCLLRAVCEQLVGSEKLGKVLEILLGMANTINARKTSGFRLASLMNLAKTTSPNNPKVKANTVLTLTLNNEPLTMNP